MFSSTNTGRREGEDCVKKIQDLLGRLKYTQPCEIEVAHRLGTYHEKQEFARPVIVRLANQSQVEALLPFGAKAKAENVKVTLQYPTELRERRKQLGEIAEDARRKGQNVTTKIVKDTLYINGERHRDPFQTLNAKDLRNLTEGEKRELSQSTFVHALASEGGSQLTVRAAKKGRNHREVP